MRCLGKIFLILILLVAGFVGYGIWQGPTLDAQSKAFVDSAVPAICSTWNKDEVLNRASPEFTQTVSKRDVSALLSALSRRLGRFVRYDGAKGDSNFGFTNKGVSLTARYVAKAQFSNGPAVIHFSLVKRGGQWQLLNFLFESPALLR